MVKAKSARFDTLSEAKEFGWEMRRRGFTVSAYRISIPPSMEEFNSCDFPPASRTYYKVVYRKG